MFGVDFGELFASRIVSENEKKIIIYKYKTLINVCTGKKEQRGFGFSVVNISQYKTHLFSL